MENGSPASWPSEGDSSEERRGIGEARPYLEYSLEG